jgi:hypothetical protein
MTIPSMDNGALTKAQHGAAMFLAGYWEESRRHKLALALSGGLLRDGWGVPTVEAFLVAVSEVAGDEEIAKRVEVVKPTEEKVKTRKPATGWPKLAELIGPDGEAVVRELRVRLGLTITLEQLAAHKELPVEYLQSLGLDDLPLGGVGIPYCDGSGQTVATKARMALQAGQRSYWPKGRPPIAYGEDRLESAAVAGYLVLVEGESDCWTLWFHGYPALGLPGADTVRRTLAIGHVSPVRKIYVIQEPDRGGEDFMSGVRQKLSALGWEGQLLVVKLDVAKDPSELHQQYPDPEEFKERFQAALDQAVPVTTGGDTSAHAASADFQPPPWPAPPGEEAFHGLAGRIVRAMEPASEADPAALLVQTVVAFGNIAGRSAHFTVEGDRHHANEFAVLVGRTSKARKGTSWGRVFRLVKEAEEQWAADRVQTGLSSGEGLIWAVRDPITKRERVKERGAPVRYEEVEADPGVEDKRLLVYEPEFANVLKQTERQGNTLSAILRQAWDGMDLRTLTKNSPARATGAHVSVIGHITADELRRYLTATETANGFGNRHLWLCADRSKLLPEGGRVDAGVWEGLRGELAQAIAFARTAGEVARDEEARAVWHDIYGPLSEGKPGLAGALLARAEAHVMRLAMSYALLDRSAIIGAAHLLAALALWDYAERSVAFVFGDSLGDPVADDLLRLLRGCPDGLTRNDLTNYLGRHQSAERIGRALGMLLQLRLARREQEETGGRPAERWFAVARGK